MPAASPVSPLFHDLACCAVRCFLGHLLGDRLSVVFRINLDTYRCRLPRFILQEIINLYRQRAGSIRVRFDLGIDGVEIDAICFRILEQFLNADFIV